MTRPAVIDEIAGRGAPSRVRVLTAVAAVVTAGILPVFLAGGLAVQLQQDLRFGPAVLGLGTAGFFGAAAVASRAMGWVVERVGPRTSMRVAALGSGACLLGLATAQNPVWLIGFLWLAGVPNSLGQPAANLLITQRIAEGSRGTAFGIKQAAIPASTLLGGLSVPVVALTVGWRWAFVLAALVGVCSAVTVPREPNVPAAARRESETDRAGSRGMLVLLAVACGLGSAAANCLGAFVTSTAVHVGFAPAVAGLVLSAGSVVGLVARLGAGAVADRWSPDLLVVITAMLLVGSAGFGLMALGTPVTFVLGALVGFGAGWAWPGLLNFAVASLYPDRVAGATSVTQTGVYVGGSSGPLLFGLLAAHLGLPVAWTAAAAVAVCAGALLVVVRRRSG